MILNALFKLLYKLNKKKKIQRLINQMLQQF